MPNKVRTQRKTVPSGISKKGDVGVYGANPSPGLSSYKQSMGPDTIPIKFAETPNDSLGTAKRQTNKMRRQAPETGRGTAKAISSSTIMKSKNRYRSVLKGK